MRSAGITITISKGTMYGSEKLRNLSKVTQLVSGRPGVQVEV
jgi:hypothetical protein